MRSCKTQLFKFVTDLANTTQKEAQTDILIMDFLKAFNIFSQANHYYGIQGKTNKWIENVLTNITSKL